MRNVNVAEFRQHLQRYLAQVQNGEALQLTVNGRVVAQLTPARDAAQEARDRLAQWRMSASIGDLLSPLGEAWEAERGRL